MKLKVLMNDTLGRVKKLRESNAVDEKTEMAGVKQGEKPEMNSCEDCSERFQLDGMSTATARFIIERDVGDKIGEVFDVKDLTNTGLYYIAKIVRPDGSVIEQLLVDKQNGRILFPKARYG